jgi:hypothetical protein
MAMSAPTTVSVNLNAAKPVSKVQARSKAAC